MALMEDMHVPGTEETTEATCPAENAALEVNAAFKTPAPTATGDDRITILKHELSLTDPVAEMPTPAGVELAIMNVSGRGIAVVAFEATFFDQEGQAISTVSHNEVEFMSDTSRALRINCTLPHLESNKVKSYLVRVVRTSTTDVESVQLRRHEMRTTETGEEHVRGIAKNIGEFPKDAAVVWTFFNPKKQDIGTRVVILRDIEPHTIRPYAFIFKPPEGDTVRTYSILVGEIAGNETGVCAPTVGSDHCCTA
jgi:hypothetical protein